MSSEARDAGASPLAAAVAMPAVRFVDDGRAPGVDPVVELADGLLANPARIAPKHFYDRLGSALFGAICELPEYYPTRTERAILDRFAGDIATAVGGGATLIDLGAADCAKADRLMPWLAPAQYVAVDISAAYLREALERLAGRHPSVDVIGIGTDFTGPFRLPSIVRRARRVFFYPGSSIGNFTPGQAAVFLRQLRTQIDDDGGLLIGVDLEKDAAIVEPAYDDALGVTAAFNLNMLHNVNRSLRSDFVPARWRHRAFLDPVHGRIEMHLVSRCDQIVSWPGAQRRFREGETIHTENSYKYARPAFEALLREAGFEPLGRWTDPRDWFAVYYVSARRGQPVDPSGAADRRD